LPLLDWEFYASVDRKDAPFSLKGCDDVLILVTNDDGIYAPGLAALEQALQPFGEVIVVAPATEQSGVGHSITFLKPLVVQEVFQGNRRRGWAVEGSPADCVKLGVFEFCPRPPDLIVSGINNGLNAGINVLYSGTVAAAIEGAFFGIRSLAVSLEYDEHAPFERAAQLTQQVLRQILAHPELTAKLLNFNIPLAAVNGPPKLRVMPMGVARYGEHFEKRTDPRGRTYYWATNEPPPPKDGAESDLTALAAGWMTLTPLNFDLTAAGPFVSMQKWTWELTPPAP